MKDILVIEASEAITQKYRNAEADSKLSGSEKPETLSDLYSLLKMLLELLLNTDIHCAVSGKAEERKQMILSSFPNVSISIIRDENGLRIFKQSTVPRNACSIHTESFFFPAINSRSSPQHGNTGKYIIPKKR